MREQSWSRERPPGKAVVEANSFGREDKKDVEAMMAFSDEEDSMK